MTTLEPEQKDILEKLNEIALEANWGTVERENGTPKAIAIIQEAMEEIKRLRELPKEIFEIIEEKLCVFTTEGKSEEYNDGYCQALSDVDERIQEVGKEYGVILDEKNS